MTAPLPARLPPVIHPDFTLRISVGAPSRGRPILGVHLFTGVRCACEHFRAPSLFDYPDISFHPPTAYPTCVTCITYASRTPGGTGPEVRLRALSRLTSHAFATRDQHIAAAVLRMLSAHPQVEPVAHLLSITASPISFEGWTIA